MHSGQQTCEQTKTAREMPGANAPPERCDDCSRNVPLKKIDCCVDSHVSSGGCCAKWVCADSCEFKCRSCARVNVADGEEDAWESYRAAVKCWGCGESTPTPVKFFGNLKGACERDCCVGCFDGADFVVLGRRSRADPTMWAREREEREREEREREEREREEREREEREREERERKENKARKAK